MRKDIFDELGVEKAYSEGYNKEGKLIEFKSSGVPTRFVKRVTAFGGSSHIVLPRSWLNKRVEVTLKEK